MPRETIVRFKTASDRMDIEISIKTPAISGGDYGTGTIMYQNLCNEIVKIVGKEFCNATDIKVEKI